MIDFEYTPVSTMDEALALLEEWGERSKLLAGGTDLLVDVKRQRIKTDRIIGLRNIQELYGIQEGDQKTRIGSLTTLSEVARHPVIKNRFPALSQAADSIGSTQVRNLGTLGGNICRSSPSADTAPALIVYDAVVCIQNRKGHRKINIEEFFIGPGLNVLAPGEIVSAICLPHAEESRDCFKKLGARKAMEIAIVNAAIRIATNQGKCTLARIAVGAVGPTPLRAKKAESFLINKELSSIVIQEAAELAAAGAQPITDHRASAQYRTEMIKTLVKRALINS